MQIKKILKSGKKVENSFMSFFAQKIMSVAGASFLNKIIAFASNVLVVRLVTQNDYGIYSSAYNIVSIAMLFTGAGTINGVLQYGAERRSDTEKQQYFKYSFLVGVFFDILLTIGVIIYAAYDWSPVLGTKEYIFLLAPTILLHYIFEYLGAIVRSEKRATSYALMMNVNSIANSILSCVGAYFWGITGLVFGRNISYVFGIIVGLHFNRKILRKVTTAFSLLKEQKKDFLKFSISCCIIAALNRLLYIIDVTAISYIVKDASKVAIYRVGTQIPEALEFIPYSVMIAVVPYVAENHKDKLWMKKWIKRIYLYSAVMNIIITAMLVVLAPIIITKFWGVEYIESVPIFIVLSINYFVMASFRQTGTNILSAIRETDYNVKISIITCMINIVLDIIFIYKWGIYGAAIATLIVVIIASILSFPRVYRLVYKGE